MFKLDTVARQLTAAGLTVERSAVGSGDSQPVPVLIVRHDYFGPYPDDDARSASRTAERIAARAGRRSEPRGYYTATFIY